MFIANSKRTFGEVRGLNCPAGATRVPAVPLSPLTIDPAHQATIASGGKCSQGLLSPICALSAALASLPPRRRSSVNSSEAVLDRGCAPQAAQMTPRSALASVALRRYCSWDRFPKRRARRVTLVEQRLVPQENSRPQADWRRQPTVCAHAFNSSSSDAVTGCDFPLAQISLRLFSARLVAASSVHAGFHEEFLRRVET